MGNRSRSSIIPITFLAGVIVTCFCLPTQRTPSQFLFGEAARLQPNRTISKLMIFIFMLVGCIVNGQLSMRARRGGVNNLFFFQD